MRGDLRMLVITPQPIEGPSTRFRIAQYLPYLASQGIVADLRPLFTAAELGVLHAPGRTIPKTLLTLRGVARRIADLRAAGRYDLVYILREAFPFGPPLIEAALSRAAGRMIFDVDDALDTPSTSWRNPLDKLRDFTKPAALMARADAVVAGSRPLAQAARAAGARSVAMLPTVVDTRVFRPDPSRRSATRPTVGWIGTPRGTSYLHPLRDAMQAVTRAVPGARFVFVGAVPFDCPGVDVTFRAWDLGREVADLQSFDIGIMPLPDDAQARGKCGFKIIEYMATGATVLCSPVGANRDIITSGRTGLYATKPEDWSNNLIHLLNTPGHRATLARAARAEAEARYCATVIAPQLRDVIRRAAGWRRAAWGQAA